MREANSPFAGSQGVFWLFAAGLVAIPFDAVIGIGALGELGYELSFPFFALAIAGAGYLALTGRSATFLDSLVLRIAAGVLALIALSFLVNFSEIGSAVFRERSGLNRFVTSLLVLLYGLALAWLAEQVTPSHFVSLVARFVAWSAFIATAYLLLEFLGKEGLLGGLFAQVDQIVHTRQADILNPWDGRLNERVAYGWDERLRSVSFEPPAFGNYAGFAWPWVWYAAIRAPPARRLRAWALFFVFTAAIIIAANRTGQLILVSSILTMAILASVYARSRRNSEGLAAARVLLVLIAAIGLAGATAWAVQNFDNLVLDVTRGDSVSNISRLGFQFAAAQMFTDHPVFGVGFGQSSLHLVQYLPDWIFLSREVHPMITYPDAAWPTTYSLYVRIAAELGLLGLVSWVSIWLILATKLAAHARTEHAAGGPLLSYHYPVILNCVAVLVSGVTTDTFRTPMIWVALGLGCGILARHRHAASMQGPAEEVPGAASARYR